MPASVLAQAAAEMLDWQGTGVGVMEMSHRGTAFLSILTRAEQDFRDLLQVPAHFRVLFMQGGGLGENAIVPLNLCGGVAAQTQGGPVADFVITGGWSQKSAAEAGKFCRSHVAADNTADQHRHIPPAAGWKLSRDAAYVHVCSNETVHGVEFHTLPDLAALGSSAPLVVDCSSHIGSRPVPWDRVGLAFAGAQKNLGPAGLTVVVVREDLLDRAQPICPSAFQYRNVADHQSMYNTPPTFAIYMAGLVFQWMKQQGGVTALEQQASAKAALLYDCIDRSSLYENRVDPACRSRMNVPFHLKNPALNEAFLAQAQERGLLQLKGHKSVGGMRASLYNAMPIEGVQALVEHLRDFERTRA